MICYQSSLSLNFIGVIPTPRESLLRDQKEWWKREVRKQEGSSTQPLWKWTASNGLLISIFHILFHKFPFHDFEYSWYHVTSYLHSRNCITQTCFQGTISKIVLSFPKGKIWLDFPEPFEYHRPIHFTNINQETWYSTSVSMTGIVSESLGLIFILTIIVPLF